MNKIVVRINFFGPYIKKGDISKILSQEFANTVFQHYVDILTGFFELPYSALSKEILERYVDATTEELNTIIVPHTKELFERLLKPLRGAKKCYCLGEYAATIALCGIVGEMLAILLWKINIVKLKGDTITEQDEIGLFGNTFEKLGQNKKLKILKTFGYISDTQFATFEKIKNSRKPYLHLWIANFENEQRDSLQIFKKTFWLFKEITGIGLADAGTAKINPLMLKLFDNLKTED